MHTIVFDVTGMTPDDASRVIEHAKAFERADTLVYAVEEGLMFRQMPLQHVTAELLVRDGTCDTTPWTVTGSQPDAHVTIYTNGRNPELTAVLKNLTDDDVVRVIDEVGRTDNLDAFNAAAGECEHLVRPLPTPDLWEGIDIVELRDRLTYAIDMDSMTIGIFVRSLQQGPTQAFDNVDTVMEATLRRDTATQLQLSLCAIGLVFSGKAHSARGVIDSWNAKLAEAIDKAHNTTGGAPAQMMNHARIQAALWAVRLIEEARA